MTRKIKAPGCGRGSKENIQENNAKHNKKRNLPPYGRRVKFAKFSQVGIAYGWLGYGCNPRKNTVVIPNGKSPCDFDWQFLRGADVFVFPSSGIIRAAYAKLLANELVACGIKSLIVFGTERDSAGRLSGFHYWPASLVPDGSDAV